MFTRIILFLATNFAVMLLFGVVANVLGINYWINQQGINFSVLLEYCFLFGMGGAVFSLMISKFIAKMSTGARVIESPQTADEQWLVSTVHRLAEKTGVGMPEVAIYDGEPNAFATGPTKNSSLVAVSTGLLTSMNREEIEAVLGHEISHVANGDMVTLTLIQGVVNTFVMFLSRVVAYVVDGMLSRNDDERSVGIGYYITVFVCDILFGFIASMIVAWFSRRREYRADAGSAKVLGTPVPMIHALARLQSMQTTELPKQLAAFGISGGVGSLFASHPPLEDRIRALQALGQ
jgi:heat shock protein HtpX